MLDAGDDLQHEPHAAQEAAAEAVVPLVDVGAHELGDQVAVGAVQFDAVEARLLDAPRPFGELLDQFVDLLDASSRGSTCPGRISSAYTTSWPAEPGMSTTWSLADNEVFARPGGLAARVLDLHGAAGPVPVHGLGQFGQAGDQRIFVDRRRT